VACLVNGDVEDRDHGLGLAEEFGADGAMIATTAEKNPSVFRSKAEGGKLPWKEVVEQYVKISMDVHNRWGNTKYLLTQMIPGKEKYYQKVNQSKNYADVCRALEFDSLLSQALEVDVSLGLDQRSSKKAEKRKATDSEAAEDNQAKRTKTEETSLPATDATSELKDNITLETPHSTVALASSG
jgi:tRNA-dihydrouridine synthase 2